MTDTEKHSNISSPRTADPEGFTDAGKVSNTDQAAATMKAVGAYLEASYLTLRGAEEALNRALAATR